MRVIILGGTGLIGRALVALLARDAYEIVVVSRDPGRVTQQFSQPEQTRVRVEGWDARSAHGWGALITKDSALVNLAGATPAHWRWTPAYRRRILESRVRAGLAVMQAIERYGPPAVLVQASASGYYGNRGQELLTETSLPGQGFRAQVCQEWEASTAHAQTRCCIVRTGLVFDANAGALPPLVHFAQLLGSRLGTGQQWLPWIHTVDIARAIQFLLEQRMLSGPFNVCTPYAATNRDVLRVVRGILQRPAVFPLPAFVLRTLLGELATVMLDSQRLLPKRLMEANFQFLYPHLEPALCNLLREHNNAPARTS